MPGLHMAKQTNKEQWVMLGETNQGHKGLGGETLRCFGGGRELASENWDLGVVWAVMCFRELKYSWCQ